LKNFASTYRHSLYGIVKAIKTIKSDFELQVGGADANLRKQIPTIGKIIFARDDARKFLQTMGTLSKNFLNIVSEQIESLSNRKLAEILGIESELDAKEIKTELLRSSPASQN